LFFSSSSEEDTVSCWQSQLSNFISTQSVIFKYGNECIAEFGEDTAKSPPSRKGLL